MHEDRHAIQLSEPGHLLHFNLLLKHLGLHFSDILFHFDEFLIL